MELILSVIATASPPFIIGWLGYMMTRGGGGASLGIIGVMLCPIVVLMAADVTKTVHREQLEPEEIRFARTSTTLLIERGEMSKKTDDAFVYMNYKDTSKVRVFRVHHDDVWGTSAPELEIEIDPKGEPVQSLELSR